MMLRTAFEVGSFITMAVLAVFFLGVIWGIAYSRSRMPPQTQEQPADDVPRAVARKRCVRAELKLVIPEDRVPVVDSTRVMRILRRGAAARAYGGGK